MRALRRAGKRRSEGFGKREAAGDRNEGDRVLRDGEILYTAAARHEGIRGAEPGGAFRAYRGKSARIHGQYFLRQKRDQAITKTLLQEIIREDVLFLRQ